MLNSHLLVIGIVLYVAIVIGSYTRIKIDNKLNRYTCLACLFMPFLCLIFLFERLPIIVSFIGREIYVKTKNKKERIL